MVPSIAKTFFLFWITALFLCLKGTSIPHAYDRVIFGVLLLNLSRCFLPSGAPQHITPLRELNLHSLCSPANLNSCTTTGGATGIFVTLHLSTALSISLILYFMITTTVEPIPIAPQNNAAIPNIWKVGIASLLW